MHTHADEQYVVMRGRACRVSDPLFAGSPARSRLVRLTRVSELPYVVPRWLEQGREIEGISPHSYDRSLARL